LVGGGEVARGHLKEIHGGGHDENHRENQGKSIGKSWKIHRKSLEHHEALEGKTHQKLEGKPWKAT
jgi:hypothetical protein